MNLEASWKFFSVMHCLSNLWKMISTDLKMDHPRTQNVCPKSIQTALVIFVTTGGIIVLPKMRRIFQDSSPSFQTTLGVEEIERVLFGRLEEALRSQPGRGGTADEGMGPTMFQNTSSRLIGKQK